MDKIEQIETSVNGVQSIQGGVPWLHCLDLLFPFIMTLLGFSPFSVLVGTPYKEIFLLTLSLSIYRASCVTLYLSS